MERILTTANLRRDFWKMPVLWVVGLLVIGWLLNTPEGLLGKADAIGYAVCHRIDLRSFHLGERPLPLCARCSGMYLGAVMGILYQNMNGRRRTGTPPWRVLIPLIFLLAAFAIDGLNSYLHLFPGFPTLYEPQNWLRLLTGSGMGLVIAALLVPAFNQTMWKNGHPHPSLDSLRSLAVLMGLILILDLLLLTDNPLVLYPLALISSAGVLLILSMVYSMLALMLLKSENLYTHAYQALLPLITGGGAALLQIAALDFIRFLFTGTWDGFHFG